MLCAVRDQAAVGLARAAGAVVAKLAAAMLAPLATAGAWFALATGTAQQVAEFPNRSRWMISRSLTPPLNGLDDQVTRTEIRLQRG